MSRHLVAKSLRVLLCLAAVYIPPACSPTRHCPTGYDVFGPYTVPYGGKVFEAMSKVRGFVWLHWHDRRRGCAEVTTTSMEEGVRCTNIYIIEPDEQGRWYILDKWKCEPGSGEIPKATSGMATWYSVQRIPQSGAGRARNQPLPDSVEVPADSYVLEFADMPGRNKSGL
jgi:hypothetical protein